MPNTPRHTALIVPPHVQAEILRLYSLTDERHRRIWSQAAIGKQLGLSETTVFRVVNRMGAYQVALKTEDEIKQEAAASAARLLKLLEAEPPVVQPKGEAASGADKPDIDPLVDRDRLNKYG